MSRRASGLKAWFLQRVTAIWVGLFALYLLATLIVAPPVSHLEWRAWVATPFNGVALYTALLALLLHAWVGLRDILIDYIHPTAIRLTLLTLTGGGLIAAAVWGGRIVILAALATPHA
jgi:succinate dehydrogenase / fumarate reductase membrane anchor subunit